MSATLRTKGQPGFPVGGMLSGLFGFALILLHVKGRGPEDARLRTAMFALGVLLIAWGLLQVWPWSNRPVDPRRRRPIFQWGLTREGIVFVVIMMTVLTGGLMTNSNLLMLVFGLLAGPFLINGAFLTAVVFAGNVVRRSAPARVMAGAPFQVDLTLENHRRWLSSWMMQAEETVFCDHEALQPLATFVCVPAGAARTVGYRLQLSRRGIYEFGSFRLSTTFPLGFVHRGLVLPRNGRILLPRFFHFPPRVVLEQGRPLDPEPVRGVWRTALEVTGPRSILVYPRVGRLTMRGREFASDADELMEVSRGRRGTHDDEFHRLREYRSGDNPRAIHWRTTARHNVLMVREYHQTRDHDLAVLLDLWAPDDSSQWEERVEWAVSFAATLCVEHCRGSSDARVTLGVLGAETAHFSGTAGPGAVEQLLDLLATVSASAQADVQPLRDPWARLRHGSVRRIVVTTRPATQDSGPAAELNPPGGAATQTIEADPALLATLMHWD